MRSKRPVILSGAILAVVAFVAFFWNAAPVEPEEAQAVAVAKQEVRQSGWKYSWVDKVERDGEQWRVSLVRFPPTFGGHATLVTSNGVVVKYFRGK